MWKVHHNFTGFYVKFEQKIKGYWGEYQTATAFKNSTVTSH